MAPLDYNSQWDLKVELFPLHSPLLRESLLVSFPPLSYMLKFSGSSYLISGQKIMGGGGNTVSLLLVGIAPFETRHARISRPESIQRLGLSLSTDRRTGECKADAHYHTALLVPRPIDRGHEPIAWVSFRF